MIAEVDPDRYDVSGHKVFRPDQRRQGLRSTAPFGRYVSQPLSVHCKNLEELRSFLAKCRQVSDQEQFGKRDYWQPPDEFEKTRKGDCDCFALWTWRQLLEMGLSSARFVAGRVGRFSTGHAWVTFMQNNKVFILEPTLAVVGKTLPRLSVLSYVPRFSVGWDQGRLSFYEHKSKPRNLGARLGLGLFAEWILFWSIFWAKNFWKLPRIGFRLIKKVIKPLSPRCRNRGNGGIIGERPNQ